mmetsp:Transcript_87584/g.183194  ORF Transcript_87584/g.183194 Transcript_87584/m.183194 type:complete len:194 (-) Transcript_87584:79-660(-)
MSVELEQDQSLPTEGETKRRPYYAKSYEEERKFIIEHAELCRTTMAFHECRDLERVWQESACPEARADKEVALAVVSANGNLLEYCSQELQDDLEVVTAAVMPHLYVIQHLGENMRGNKELMLKAVQKCGFVLQWATEELRNDREVVMEAVKEDPKSLEYASEDLQHDPELLEIVANTPIYACEADKPKYRQS